MLPENLAENCVISEAPPDIAYFHRSRLFRSFGGNCTSSRRECAESISEIPSFRLKAGRAQRRQAFQDPQWVPPYRRWPGGAMKVRSCTRHRRSRVELKKHA